MIKIAISVGHHPGAKGASYSDLVEFDLAEYWVNEILDQYDDLYDYEYNCPIFHLLPVPTGTLKEKVKFINENEFDYAIEMHFNSAGVTASGSETLYMPNSKRGKKLASIIQKNISVPLEIRDRGVKEGMYWSTSERTNTPLYFLRRTNCPAVIIEPNFLQSYYIDKTNEKVSDFAYAFLESLLEVIEKDI